MSGERFSDWCCLLGKCWFSRSPSAAGTGEFLPSAPQCGLQGLSAGVDCCRTKDLSLFAVPLSRCSALWLGLCWTGAFVRLPSTAHPCRQQVTLTLCQGCPSSGCQHRNWANSRVYPHLALKKTSEIIFKDFHQRGKINSSGLKYQI